MRVFAQKTNQPEQSASATHSKLRLQPNLKLTTPGGSYEQEADRVADQVTNMNQPELRRVCACGGGCPTCMDKQTAPEHLQMNSIQSNDIPEIEAPSIVKEVLRSPGQPLDSTTRAVMEPRFGHDFSQVRVHTDERAVKSANAIGAHAYTVGHHIAFGSDQYRPKASEGRLLLAHELSHVVQQTGYEPESGGSRLASLSSNSISLSVQRQLAAASEFDEAEEQVGVVVDDPKSSNAALTIKVQIVSGSKPQPGQPNEEKTFGGKAGGHVVINLGAEGVFGFSNDQAGGHFFAKGGDAQDSKFDHYSEQEWELKTKNKQVVTFEINLTLDQLGTLKQAFQGEPDVDYSVLGYRCASYALRALKEAGVIESSNFKIKYFLAVTPGALVRFLQRLGYKTEVQKGSEKRQWNTKFNEPPQTEPIAPK